MTDNGQLTTDSQQSAAKSSRGFLARCAITFILIALSGWLLHHNWQLRRIRYNDYTYTAEEAEKLKSFPVAHFAYGMRAWSRGDAQRASEFFQRAVSEDPLYVDAWLRLAESEAALGHPEKSKKILMFTDHLASGIHRWQWPRMLLARDLGMEDVFLRNANDLLAHRKLTQDTLHLLDLHFEGNSTATVAALNSENLVPYLQWLMRWGRVDASAIVWQRMVKEGRPDADVALQYTHFLVSKKRVPAARDIWHEFYGIEGMTNAGFENQITRRGFDWRYSEDKKQNWEIRRISTSVPKEYHALRIRFAGAENISFHHLYQIVPVVPLQTYRLSYFWKSKWITTDQGPFVEIYGYDQNGLHHKGPMMTGTNLWHNETIEFTAPENCHAVVVRLRRLQSHRFDSKIAGTLWLDDFKLEKLNAESSKLKAQIEPQIN
jgi:tetratricopeptide (TPR) repeat protein